MTIVEVALAIILVAGAGWLVRGFSALRATQMGFSTAHRFTFDLTLQGARFPNQPVVVSTPLDAAGPLHAGSNSA